MVTLDRLIRLGVEEFTQGLRVCMPGRVESYDAQTHLASVQPLLKTRLYNRAQPELLPVVSRVPVVHPRSQRAIVKVPIARGDIVTMVFADRSIENWLQGSGEAREPFDVRRHHLTDAYAIPGGYPEGAPRTTPAPGALELVVDAGTKVYIGNGEQEVLQIAHDAFTRLKELADELSTTLQDIQSITHTDSQGGTTGPPLNAAAFAATKTSVDAIASAVQTIADDLAELKV